MEEVMMNQRELQAIAGQAAQYLKLTTTPALEIKSVERGQARTKTGKITVPEWVLGEECQGRAYQKWYVTHEVIHFHSGRRHSARFKQVEAEAMSTLFGIEIVRFRRRWPYPWRPCSNHYVYPVSLRDKETGKVLWIKRSAT